MGLSSLENQKKPDNALFGALGSFILFTFFFFVTWLTELLWSSLSFHSDWSINRLLRLYLDFPLVLIRHLVEPQFLPVWDYIYNSNDLWDHFDRDTNNDNNGDKDNDKLSKEG